MSLFGWLGSIFDDPSNSCGTTINPASGLPMVDGTCGVDVAGNFYGTDNNSSTHDTDSSSWDSSSSFDSGMSIGSDTFSSFDSGIDTGSSFDSSSSFNDW